MSLQAIVLAAGAGSRFGGGKLLADWQGRPLVLWAVEIALATEVSEVIVVTGCDRAAVEAALSPLTTARLRTIFAEDWRDGLSASLKAGVRAVPEDSAGALVFLGDMPLVPLDLSQAVAGLLCETRRPVQPWRNSEPGHPVGLPASYYSRIAALTGDAGAGRLLRDDPAVVRLDTDAPGATFDVDRP